MENSYSQLLKDIKSGEINSIILIPYRREVIVEFSNGKKEVIPVFYNHQQILRISEDYKVPLSVRDIRSEQRSYWSRLDIDICFFSFIFNQEIIKIIKQHAEFHSPFKRGQGR